MSSPLRSCEEDEGMVVNSEGGDFDEEDDDGDLDENASDINSPAAPRETATPAAPGTVKEKLADKSGARAHTKLKKPTFLVGGERERARERGGDEKIAVVFLEVAAVWRTSHQFAPLRVPNRTVLRAGTRARALRRGGEKKK